MRDPFSLQIKSPKGLYVNRESKRDDVAFDFYNNEENSEDEQDNEFLGKFMEVVNLKILLFFLIFGIGILAFRAYYLQIQKGNYYNSMSKGNRVRTFSIPASRGIVFDRNGEILVRNIPRFAVFITVADLPANLEEQKNVLKKLSELIDVEIGEIKNIILKQKELRAIYKPVSIKDNLEYTEALVLEIAIKELAGVNMEVSQQREYLGGNSFSPIMGYVGKIDEEEYKERKDDDYFFNDIIGKVGIEYSYEDNLRGVNGFKEVEVDALGKRKKVLSTENPRDGDNLYLTIDKEFQDKASEIVLKKLQEEEKARASVVILNPQNGEILALLSVPSYDNNLFAQGIKNDDYKKLIDDPDKPMFFRAIAGEYASGSVIKPVWSAAALQEGIITKWTTLQSSGGISIGAWFFPDWRAGGHGLTDVKKAIADSVNSFYYYVCGGYGNFAGMGIDKMVHYAELFNMGRLSGIDIPGERFGFFPSPAWKKEFRGEGWYIGDTYHVAIGQGDFLATPLQVADWTAFFANEGEMVKPHLVGQISHDQEIKIIEKEVIRKDFINSEHIRTVKEGMRQGVTKGSSKFLSDLCVEVSGKTGTAQWNSKKENNAWWSGFFPYDNPEVVITILVEEGGEGSAISVPIAKDIIQWWCENRNMKIQKQ